jgi:hypothetical protein
MGVINQPCVARYICSFFHSGSFSQTTWMAGLVFKKYTYNDGIHASWKRTRHGRLSRRWAVVYECMRRKRGWVKGGLLLGFV